MMPRGKRDRSRDGIGKSDQSFLKHEMLWSVFPGQAGAYRASHPNARILIVDANAGDGEGVKRAQLDLFGDDISTPTSGQVVRVANDFGCSCVFCEKNAERRAKLQAHYPSVPILRNSSDVVGYVAGFDWVLVLSDPCGPRDHNVNALVAIAQRVPSDFILVQNLAALNRIAGTHDDGGPPAMLSKEERANRTSRTRYMWHFDPHEWRLRLQRRHLSSTVVKQTSAAFQPRILVVANHLSAAAQRRPFKVLK